MPIKKIFVCEFITGGGLCGEPLPDSLAKEGALMRDALLSDLSELNVDILSTFDVRVKNTALQATIWKINGHAGFTAIKQDDDIWAIWTSQIAQADAVLVIAPETDGVLLKFAQLTHSLGKIWLGCGRDAIEICADKIKTADFLQKNYMPVPTFSWQTFCDYQQKNPEVFFANGGKMIAKPIDGAGCVDTFVFDNVTSLSEFMAPQRKKSHIIQCFIQGQSASFVMLCTNNQAHLLCCNKQIIEIKNNQLAFKGVQINAYKQHWDIFARVADYLQERMPSLQGLVGVDVVFDENKMMVIEINPRLTTSYVGLRLAIGVNPAKLLLESSANTNFIMPKINKNVVIIYV